MIKRILLILLGVVVLIGLYILYDLSGYASGVAEDAKVGLFTKWNYSDLKDGDIIFQTSRSSQSKAIQIATKSKYSHMGIIYKKKNEYYVYEAVQPVKLTPLREWILRGVGRHFVVKRLKEREKYLTKANLAKMFDTGETFKGKNYDIYFNWSDEQIYCSELVWKIYNSIGIQIGKLQKLKDFDLSSSVVRNKLKERYGNNIPFNETVVSPAAIYKSNMLKVIIEN